MYCTLYDTTGLLDAPSVTIHLLLQRTNWLRLPRGEEASPTYVIIDSFVGTWRTSSSRAQATLHVTITILRNSIRGNMAMAMDPDKQSGIYQEGSCIDDDAQSPESRSTRVDAAGIEHPILEEDGASTPADRPDADQNTRNKMILSMSLENQQGAMPVQGPQMLESTKQYGWMSRGSELPYYVLCVSFLLGYLMWHFCKYKTEHKEWQQSSKSHLEEIRQRNSQSSSPDTNSDSTTIDNKQRVDKTNEHHASEEVVTDTGVDSKLGGDISSSDKDSDGALNSGASVVETTANDSSKGSEALPVSASTPAEHISKIRARQQEQLERNTKSAQRHHNLQQTKKKQTLHKSLGHDAADKAHQRRINAMEEEQAHLQSRREEQLRQEEEQRQLHELEEMERIALLQQQDLDYRDSLLHDQERSQQLALEKDVMLKRQQAIEMAKQRLTIAGVESSAISQRVEAHSSGGGSRNNVKVRLLFPSGRRVEATFAADHDVGVVYDLALVVLDRDDMLWGQENGNCDDSASDEEDTMMDSGISDATDYNIIHEEWKPLFFSFSLSSTYPQRTYDTLSLTLEECGLRQSAMLMVVVESD